MEIFSRKLNEELVLDESVRVRIIALNEGQVRLGITVPGGTPIDRVPRRPALDARNLDCESMLIPGDLVVTV